MIQVLRRAELPIQIKMNNESDERYCDKLKEVCSAMIIYILSDISLNHSSVKFLCNNNNFCLEFLIIEHSIAQTPYNRFLFSS